ncbi:MAG: TolC family protein [Planctomycetota bacterium]|jgi:cobalt-zinc-cadmium efflux system outer membrane protein
MRLRLLPQVVLFALIVSGCVEQSNEVAPVLSGREYGVARPTQNSDVSKTADPTGVVTLAQALALALEHNPELKASSWDVRAAEAGRLQASLMPNPSLGVQIEELGRTSERSGFDGAESAIKITQPIELGQKRARRTTLASLERELAEWDYKTKQLDVTREVTEAFVAVLASQERLALTEELVGVAEQAHNAVTQRVEAGRDSPIEQTKSAVALSTIRIEQQKTERVLESARKGLAATWGGRTAGFDTVAGRFDKIMPVPSSAELGRLVSQNPDIARWAVEKEARRAALELEKARAVSDVTISGGWQRFNETDESAAILGLSIPLPISNRNQGGIRRATYMLAKAEESHEAAEIKILAALEEAAQRLAGAYVESIALKGDVLPGAQSSFDAVSEGYRDGKFDYLQVLYAQRTLFERKGRYIESLTAYHKAKADTERLIGQSIESIKEIHENNHKETQR